MKLDITFNKNAKAKTPAILVNAITRDSTGLLTFLHHAENIKILTPLYLKDASLPAELNQKIDYLFDKNIEAQNPAEQKFALDINANAFFANAGDKFVQIFNNIIRERENLAISTIDYLEQALENYDILLVLVTNEGFIHEKIMLEFAKKHNIPSLHANHGLVLRQTTSAYTTGNCDYYACLSDEDKNLLLYDNLANPKINAQAIGFPALDKYYLLNSAKEKFIPQNLPKDKKIITYFTSFDNTTYVRDNRIDTYTRTLETGVKMASQLHADANTFVIIKDRPTNYAFAKEKFEILISKYPQIDPERIIYVFEQPEPYVLASDIVVFNSSTLAIEGILADALAININYNYADFAPIDHLPCLDSDEDIGEFILYLLADKNKFAMLKNLQKQAKYLIGDMGDGLSSLRMAQYIAQIIGYKASEQSIARQIERIKNYQMLNAKPDFAILLDSKNPDSAYWHLINSLINYDQRFKVKDAYQDWRNQNKNLALAGDLMAKRMLQNWQFMPSFHLIYIVDSSMFSALSQSLAALEYQLYTNVIISVISTDKIPDENLLALPNFNWIESPTPFASVNNLISQVASDWVILPIAGDELSFDALFYFAEQANLRQDALAIYCDEDCKIDAKEQDFNLPNNSLANKDIDAYYANSKFNRPEFKPDFNLELQRSTDYIGQTTAFRSEAISALGGFNDSPYNQIYAMIFTLAEKMTSPAVSHIAKVLNHKGDIAKNIQNNEIIQQAKALILKQHLLNSAYEQKFTIKQGLKAQTFKTEFEFASQPKIGVLLEVYPNKNLRFSKSLSSLALQDYKNFEVYIGISEKLSDNELQILNATIESLKSKIAIQTFAMTGASKRQILQNLLKNAIDCDFWCFMQSDMELMHSTWLDEMLNHFAKNEVALLGGRIINSNGQIISAGQILGFNQDVDDIYKNFHLEQDLNALPRLWSDQNYSALNPLGLMLRKSAFEAVQGFDADFSDYYLFADLGIRLQLAGYRLHWTPYATSLSYNENFTWSQNRQKEKSLWFEKWSDVLLQDVNHNINLELRASGNNLSKISPLWQAEIKQLPRIINLGLHINQTDSESIQAITSLLDYLHTDEKILLAQNLTVFEEQEGAMPNLLEAVRHNPEVIVFSGKPFYSKYKEHINIIKARYNLKFIAIVASKADVAEWQDNFASIDSWIIYNTKAQNLDNLPANCDYLELDFENCDDIAKLSALVLKKLSN